MTYIVPSEALNSTHSDTMMGTSRKRVVERFNLFTLKLAALISSNKFQEMPQVLRASITGQCNLAFGALYNAGAVFNPNMDSE